MHDYWNNNAAKLKAELMACGIEPDASMDVISASAGSWFSAMGQNEKTAVIATMRNLTQP